MMENHGYTQIIGNSQAPYINSLAKQGASFTASHGVTHPSQPNYVALFSGSTQGLTDDSCPHTYSTSNLASLLLAAHFTFDGYAESMPKPGYTGCVSGEYERKHAPWTDFKNVPTGDSHTWNGFPSDYTKLPTLSFVIPNMTDDMHDGTVAQGDAWLKSHINSYASWAKTHNSLLVVTWDEDDRTTSANRIPTIFVGQHVKLGKYSENINHYNVLRTLEDAYGLSHLGGSANASPIVDVWTP